MPDTDTPTVLARKAHGRVRAAVTCGPVIYALDVAEPDAARLAGVVLDLAAHPGAVEAWARAVLAVAEEPGASVTRRFKGEGGGEVSVWLHGLDEAAVAHG